MKSKDFVFAVRARLGQGYWYGTYSGHVSSEALLSGKSQQYPAQYTQTYILRSRRWLDGNKYSKPNGTPGTGVQDCVGLIKGTVWIADFGGKYQSASDLSANGMFLKCTSKGAISTIPETPGVLVHMPGHIGIYVGGGKVIESRGVDYGVVETVLSERPWVDWGLCHLIDYSDAEPDWEEECAKKDAEIADLENQLQTCQNNLNQTTIALNAATGEAKRLQGLIDAYNKAVVELK